MGQDSEVARRLLDRAEELGGDDPRMGLTYVASAVGALDLFVFRRVTGDRFVHVGGIGRGEGWAGIVDVHLSEEPRMSAAYTGREPEIVAEADPVRIVGPYYACGAALVPVTADVVVVLGHPQRAVRESDPEILLASARVAADLVTQVSSAKRLADELEVLHAVKNLTSFTEGSLEGVMHHVVRVASDALSCEIAVLYLAGERRLAASRDLSAGVGSVAAVMQGFDEASLPRCEQECGTHPLPPPFSPRDGVVSYYALPVGSTSFGTLLLVHTHEGPRGFTKLCREIGVRLAESAEGVLRVTAQRERLEREVAVARNAASN